MASSSPYWQGPHIRLRPMHRDDVDLWLVEEQEDAEATYFLNAGMPLPKSRHDADAFATKYAEFGSSEERLMFSIETLDGTLVGGMNLHSMDRTNGTFQTGSRIYRAFRGRGYGLEAKHLLLRYAFHELRFQKYEVRCSEHNDAMVRHMARLGAVPEGRLRRHLYTRGTFEDELCFGLTREEFDAFEARQPAP
ncbi:MAG: GNAT family N-acetyltransferase [Trueperaceae bacterium]